VGVTGRGGGVGVTGGEGEPSDPPPPDVPPFAPNTKTISVPVTGRRSRVSGESSYLFQGHVLSGLPSKRTYVSVPLGTTIGSSGVSLPRTIVATGVSCTNPLR